MYKIKKRDDFLEILKRKPRFFTKINILIVFFVIIILLFSFLIFSSNKKNKFCGDGTAEGFCSNNQPYFCEDGKLIEKASICGCPEILNISGDSCISNYYVNEKNLTLNYILRGKEGEINLSVYGGLANYLFGKSKEFYFSNNSINRTVLEHDRVNEEAQREALIPLLVKIENLKKNKIDQARIAVSLVQNIPYSSDERLINFRDKKLKISIYPYQALYDDHASCEEKSWLMEILLKELGFGVSSIYYPDQNHEAVGIKCPIEYSLNNSGYCFVETTGNSIISYDKNYYSKDVILNSTPSFIFISYGAPLKDSLYEYKDAKKLSEINSIRLNSKLTISEYIKFKKLVKKYGLRDI